MTIEQGFAKITLSTDKFAEVVKQATVSMDGFFRALKGLRPKIPIGRRLQQAKAVGRAYARNQYGGTWTRWRYQKLRTDDDHRIRWAAQTGWLQECMRLYPDKEES